MKYPRGHDSVEWTPFSGRVERAPFNGSKLTHAMWRQKTGAYPTTEYLLIMRLLMMFKISTLNERELTDVTLVRFFARMDLFVIFES